MWFLEVWKSLHIHAVQFHTDFGEEGRVWTLTLPSGLNWRVNARLIWACGAQQWHIVLTTSRRVNFNTVVLIKNPNTLEGNIKNVTSLSHLYRCAGICFPIRCDTKYYTDCVCIGNDIDIHTMTSTSNVESRPEELRVLAVLKLKPPICKQVINYNSITGTKWWCLISQKISLQRSSQFPRAQHRVKLHRCQPKEDIQALEMHARDYWVVKYSVSILTDTGRQNLLMAGSCIGRLQFFKFSHCDWPFEIGVIRKSPIRSKTKLGKIQRCAARAIERLSLGKLGTKLSVLFRVKFLLLRLSVPEFPRSHHSS